MASPALIANLLNKKKKLLSGEKCVKCDREIETSDLVSIIGLVS